MEVIRYANGSLINEEDLSKITIKNPTIEEVLFEVQRRLNQQYESISTQNN